MYPLSLHKQATMQNLYKPTAAAHIIARLQALQPTAQAQWGKMNVAQMLAHCQAPFETYFGHMKLKQSFIGLLFGGFVKKKLFSNQPWKKNLPTAKEFMVFDERDFNIEKEKLLSFIKRFIAEGKNISSPKHPFFGKMNHQEWGILAYKHLDHHLQQFGV